MDLLVNIHEQQHIFNPQWIYSLALTKFGIFMHDVYTR